MLFYWPKLLYPYYNLLLFSHSLLSIYRLVLWGWGLRTDKVYITLSQPCTADLFFIIIIIIIIIMIKFGECTHPGGVQDACTGKVWRMHPPGRSVGCMYRW